MEKRLLRSRPGQRWVSRGIHHHPSWTRSILNRIHHPTPFCHIEGYQRYHQRYHTIYWLYLPVSRHSFKKAPGAAIGAGTGGSSWYMNQNQVQTIQYLETQQSFNLFQFSLFDSFLLTVWCHYCSIVNHPILNEREREFLRSSLTSRKHPIQEQHTWSSSWIMNHERLLASKSRYMYTNRIYLQLY